jgi:hypothetical protein
MKQLQRFLDVRATGCLGAEFKSEVKSEFSLFLLIGPAAARGMSFVAKVI